MNHHKSSLTGEISTYTQKLRLFASTHKDGVILLITSIAITSMSCIHYISTMLNWTSPGFSLDDSWIHLQYARSIYDGIPWEYSPGVPSTGSTSPIWSILLSIIFFFTNERFEIIWITITIAIMFYIMSSILVAYIGYNYTNNIECGILATIGFVIIPRNTWIMLSGMEVPLFIFLLLLAVVICDRQGERYDLMLGIIVGLTYLARPEGVILAFVCYPTRFIMVLWKKEFNLQRICSLLIMVSLSLLIVSPWVFHCLSITGHPLPDTFYAKVHPVTEDAVAVWNFYLLYWLYNYWFIIIGIAMGIFLIAKGKPILWLIPTTLVILYRITMPYQALMNNARYLVPVFEFYMLSCILGIALFVREIVGKNEYKISEIGKRRNINRKMKTRLSYLVIFSLFIVPLIPEYLSQGELFGNSVKNINEQQLSIGLWLRDNTPEDAVFTVCDVGAVRFFSERSVIDLVGLVTPDIIHGNMTYLELTRYVRDHGSSYFVLWEDWFDILFKNYLGSAYSIIYNVTLIDNVICGRDTLLVYCIDWNNTSI